MADDTDDWFIREVLPHEAALVRYIARVWPNRAEVQDIRHDAYVRILERIHELKPTAPKSLLFATARNLMVDRARRNRIVPIDLLDDLDSLNILVDDVTPEHRVSIRQQLARVSWALSRLPDRCREALWLRRVENLPYKTIATKLGVTVGTIEKNLARAARLLPDLLADGADPDTQLMSQRHTKEGKHHGN